MKRLLSHLLEWLDDLLFPVTDEEDELHRLQREVRRLTDENETLKKELRKLKRDRH